MKNYRSLFNKVSLGVALVTAVALGLAGCTSYEEAEKEGFYSTGTRVGTVTKLSYEGIMASCKTWEGELAMDNFDDSEENTWSIFPFTVRDEKLVEKLQQAQIDGTVIQLQYDEIFFPVLCETSSGNFIKSVSLALGPK